MPSPTSWPITPARRRRRPTGAAPARYRSGAPTCPTCRSAGSTPQASSTATPPTPGTPPRRPAEAAAGTRSPAPMRVGVVADPGGLGVHPDVRAAVEAAAGALGDAGGYAVEEAEDVPRLADTLDA